MRKDEIINLRSKGYGYRKIGFIMKMNHGHVYSILNGRKK